MLHARGESTDGPLGIGIQFDHRQQLIHPRRARSAAEAVQDGKEPQVLARGETPVETAFIGDDRRQHLSHLSCVVGDIEAADRRGSGIGGHKRGQNPEQRALARAIWAEQSEELSFADPDGYLPQCLHPPTSQWMRNDFAPTTVRWKRLADAV